MRASLPEGSPRVLTTPRLLFILAALAAAVYAPILAFPFIGASYTEIPTSRFLSASHNFAALVANPAWHFRWTYIFTNSAIIQLFGFTPRPFYAASICFHVLCVWAVYAMGSWSKLGWKAAAWAAAFFAIYEGHQGAVAFLTGWPELIVTLFGCACFVFWVRWLESHKWHAYALAAVCFVGALFSMESGVAVALVLAIPVVLERRHWKRGIIGLLPFLLAGAAYVAVLINSVRADPRVYDAMFALPPMPSSNPLDRPWVLLFLCGLFAAALVLWRWRENWQIVAASFGWMLLAFLPYGLFAFLRREPSGATYFASVGLAWIVGVIFARMSERLPVAVVALTALLVAGVNADVLWTQKHRQSLQLAAPTEALINAIPYSRGPIQLTCFPYPVQIAIAAVHYAGGDLIIDGTPQQVRKPHCVSFHYKDILGNIREVMIHSAF
jgi:hypothetical protein